MKWEKQLQNLISPGALSQNKNVNYKYEKVPSWFFNTNGELAWNGDMIGRNHVPYARLGIPSIMYTTLLHDDYHTPLDNAENINYPKLKKMADWMYRTGYKVANATVRPATDKDFKLER